MLLIILAVVVGVVFILGALAGTVLGDHHREDRRRRARLTSPRLDNYTTSS